MPASVLASSAASWGWLDCLAVAFAELLDDRFTIGCRERLQLDLAWLARPATQFLHRRAVMCREDNAAVSRQVLRQPLQIGGA